jgi:hypothetical protein
VPGVPLQERVELTLTLVLVRETLEGNREQPIPVPGDVEFVRETVPANPPVAAIWIVELPVLPKRTLTVVGVTVTLKSVVGCVTCTEIRGLSCGVDPKTAWIWKL